MAVERVERERERESARERRRSRFARRDSQLLFSLFLPSPRAHSFPLSLYLSITHEGRKPPPPNCDVEKSVPASMAMVVGARGCCWRREKSSEGRRFVKRRKNSLSF
jgi:hypothetical protein